MKIIKLDDGGKFKLGNTVSTQGALAKLTFDEILFAFRRHSVGDWGDVSPADKARNDEALTTDGRLLSIYHTTAGTKFFVITEWDRSYTTVLLPHEY
jgi:hypothetical protein